MRLERCDEGHFYDAERFPQGCPYCQMQGEPLEKWIPERFERLGKIRLESRGATSSVYAIRGDKTYALKVMDCGSSREKYQHAQHEIAVMERLKGVPNAVQMLDCSSVTCKNQTVVCILEPYHVSLAEFLKDRTLTAEGIRRLGAALTKALLRCRKAGVLHLDIQPRNIYLDNLDTVYLGDFGTALFCEELDSAAFPGGTVAYMAPEVYQTHKCSEQGAIYSVGLVLYTMLNHGMLPFEKELPAEQAMQKRLRGEPLPRPVGCEEAEARLLWEVISTLCAPDPKNRPDSLEEALESLTDLNATRKKWLDELFACASAPIGSVFPTAKDENNTDSTSEPLWSESPDSSIRATTVTLPLEERETCKKRMLDDCSVEAQTSPRLGAGEADTWADSWKNTQESTWNTVLDCQYDWASDCQCDSDGGLLDERYSWDEDVLMTGSPDLPTLAQPEPELTVDKVQFSAVAPKTLEHGEYAKIDLLMYTDACRGEVDRVLQEADGPVKETRAGVLKVQQGKEVRVKLTSPDIPIDDGEDTRIWQGDYLDFGFVVMLPEDYKKRQVLFQAKVYIDKVIATKLTFLASCAAEKPQNLQVRREDIMSAFVSYASEDRVWVLTAVEGMKKARQDLNIFTDVENLRSGEHWEKRLYAEIDDRDVLFLFWSRAAKKSPWVEREWRYAYKSKGADAIEPVPIEPPSLCPPPEELAQKHFNDSSLYIIQEERKHLKNLWKGKTSWNESW